MSSEEKSPKRPVILTVLCILTFISAGMGIVSSFVTPLLSDLIVDFLKTTPTMDQAMKDESLLLLQAGWGYYMVTLVLMAGPLTGAILMWNLNKKGIHFYAIANLGLLFVPTLMLGISISWVSIMFTSFFIALYASNLKLMK